MSTATKCGKRHQNEVQPEMWKDDVPRIAKKTPKPNEKYFFNLFLTMFFKKQIFLRINLRITFILSRYLNFRVKRQMDRIPKEIGSGNTSTCDML